MLELVSLKSFEKVGLDCYENTLNKISLDIPRIQCCLGSLLPSNRRERVKRSERL